MKKWTHAVATAASNAENQARRDSSDFNGPPKDTFPVAGFPDLVHVDAQRDSLPDPERNGSCPYAPSLREISAGVLQRPHPFRLQANVPSQGRIDQIEGLLLPAGKFRLDR